MLQSRVYYERGVMKFQKLSVYRDKGRWWISDKNNADCDVVGPYATRKEAEEDRVGLIKFYRNSWKDWVNVCASTSQ